MRRLSAELLRLLLGLLVIYTLVFAVSEVASVDAARSRLGPAADEQTVARLRHELGLDRPMLARYGSALQRMVRGDFGESSSLRRPAGEVVAIWAPLTLARATLGLALGWVVSLFAAREAVRRGIPAVRALFSLLEALPSFCLLVLLLWWGARLFGQTPLGNRALYEVFAVLAAAAYPAGATGMFVYERCTGRSARPLHVEFMEMLHAPPEAILQTLWREALPGAAVIGINALVAALTAVSFSELIFGIQGFGGEFFRACQRGDLPLIVAGSLIVAVIVLALQTVGDAVLRRTDPRIGRTDLF